MALVAGATGLVGGECLSRLLADARYGRVWALARRPLPEHPRLTTLPADYESLAPLPLELEGGDVFCCLGTTIGKAGSAEAFRRVDYDYVLALARRAAERRARTFLLVSSSGANAGSRLLYPRVKGEAERDVAALPFRSVRLLRPSLLLGKRAESRPAEALGRAMAPLLSRLMIGPLKKYRPIEADVVARAMLRLAAEPTPGVVVIESDELQAL